MTAMPVAQTIYDQLGGHRFKVMTGAKNVMSDGNALVFGLGTNKIRANRVRIELKNDLYDLTFSRVASKMDAELGFKVPTATELKVVTGVYAENLREVFTSVTGLYTSMRG